MEDSLKQKIQSDMKDAMRAKDALRLGTIRMLMAAIKQREVDERITLSDTDIYAVINKMVKQRRESAKQFRDGNRPELADKEEQEITQLNAYLPTALDDAELKQLITDAITSTGAKNLKDMGAVMNIVRPKAQGRADMSIVSALIKEKLQ